MLKMKNYFLKHSRSTTTTHRKQKKLILEKKSLEEVFLDYLSVWWWYGLFSHIKIILIQDKEDGHWYHGQGDHDQGDHGHGHNCLHYVTMYYSQSENSFRHIYITVVIISKIVKLAETKNV